MGTAGLFGPPEDAAIKIQRKLAAGSEWASHSLSPSATAARVVAHLEQRVELVGEGAEMTFLAPYSLRRR